MRYCEQILTTESSSNAFYFNKKKGSICWNVRKIAGNVTSQFNSDRAIFNAPHTAEKNGVCYFDRSLDRCFNLHCSVRIDSYRSTSHATVIRRSFTLWESSRKERTEDICSVSGSS